MKSKKPRSKKKLADIIRDIVPYDVINGTTPIAFSAAFSMAQQLRKLGCDVDFKTERMIIKKDPEKIVFSFSND